MFVFRKIWFALFSCNTPVLRFTLLPYCRRVVPSSFRPQVLRLFFFCFFFLIHCEVQFQKLSSIFSLWVNPLKPGVHEKLNPVGLFNPFQPSVAFHIETSHLSCRATFFRLFKQPFADVLQNRRFSKISQYSQESTCVGISF